MTRGEVRALARKGLGETTAAFWTDVELNDWIDEAGHDLAFRTKSIRTNGYLTTVEDTFEYGLSANFSGLISVTEVFFYSDATTWQKMTSTTRDDLNRLHEGWRSAGSGTPDQYYYDREEDLFGIYVKPNSTNAGTNYVHVYYAKDYTEITDDNVTPALPAYLHKAMADYAVSLGFRSRGYLDKANDIQTKYEVRINMYLAERNRGKEDEDLIMIPEQNLRRW